MIRYTANKRFWQTGNTYYGRCLPLDLGIHWLTRLQSRWWRLLEWLHLRKRKMQQMNIEMETIFYWQSPEDE